MKPNERVAAISICLVFILILLAPLARAHGGETFQSHAYGLRFTLPKALINSSDSIGEIIDFKLDEFMDQCTKFRPKVKCKAAIKATIVQVINDYTYYCGGISPTSLCAGDANAGGGGLVRVILYNKINANVPEDCDDGFKIRTRKGMHKLSRGNAYWLRHRSELFCGNVDDPLPALVHEICHYFGAASGHGKRQNCQ